MKDLYRDLARACGFVLWGDEAWNPGDVIDWASSYDKELEAFADALVRHVATVAGEAAYFAEGEGLKDYICKELGVEVVDRYVLNVEEGEDGDCFIQLPMTLIDKMGWGEGTTLKWEDKGDGSFSLTADA